MAKIHTIRARSILDSSGYPTVEATIWLDNGAFGVSSTSANTTNSKSEAFEIRDKDPSKYFGLGVNTVVNTINTIIAPKLKGLDPTQQSNIDKILLELDGTKNKSKSGANAILPVSIATLKAGASLFQMSVYEYIGKKYQLIKDNYVMPMPIIAIINGGKYGLGSLDFQEFQIIPSSRHAFPEAMRLSTEVYHAVEKSLISNDAIHSTGRQGGFTPNLYTNIDALEIIYEAVKTTSYFTGQDLFLGIDAAADDIYKSGKYSIKDRSKVHRSWHGCCAGSERPWARTFTARTPWCSPGRWTSSPSRTMSPSRPEHTCPCRGGWGRSCTLARFTSRVDARSACGPASPTM